MCGRGGCVEECFSVAPPRGKLFAGECVVEWPRRGAALRCSPGRDGGGGFALTPAPVALAQIVRLAATHP